MVKKKATKEMEVPVPKKEEYVEKPENVEVTVDQPKAEVKKAVVPTPKSSGMKNIAIIILLVVVLALAYYFLSGSDNRFIPGSSVDAETFKSIFGSASNVFIVMDIRGASDSNSSNNVLQCGVDFAGSSGMGGKNVVPISVGDEGCITPDGKRDPKECFGMLRNGLTIYIKEGPGGVTYYSNGMVVTVNQEYKLGTCGIKRY